MYAAHYHVKECARKRRSHRGWRRSISASFFEGRLRHPVPTPKTIGTALVEVFAVILPVEATTPVVNAPPDIRSEHGVCNAWRDGHHYDQSRGDGSKHPVGVHLVVGSPSPSRGESRRPGTLPAVVNGTDSHWQDPWPNIALRSVPHA